MFCYKRDKPYHSEPSEEFLTKLVGVSDPETKRKIIRETFIHVFDREAKKHDGIGFLAQGTLYRCY